MATTPVNARVQRHRDALRMAGLRPVHIWVPDTRRPGRINTAMQHLMDEALTDVDGWTH